MEATEEGDLLGPFLLYMLAVLALALTAVAFLVPLAETLSMHVDPFLARFIVTALLVGVGMAALTGIEVLVSKP